MKKLILIGLLIFSTTSFAQSFKFNPDGTSDWVVYTAENQTAKELYSKALNWINVNYKNPEKVIIAKTENEMIRTQGVLQPAFSRTFKSGTVGDYDVLYDLVFEFQDGKFRMKFNVVNITIEGNKVFFTLDDVLNNKPDGNGNGFDNCKAQFEGNVVGLMTIFAHYITKPKEKW